MMNILTYVTHALLGCWQSLESMAPYLLFGFAAAGVLSVVMSPAFIERHLGGRGIWPVFKATVLGIPLPLCSCSVIPVTLSLRKHGASKGAAVGFLLSTPETGVDSIIVTYGMLGPVFAIVRPVVALITGLVGGGLVELLDRGNGGTPTPAACHDDCCEGPRRNPLIRMITYALVTLPRDLAKPLVVGLVVAGLIGAVVPDDFFASKLGTGLVPMLVMMAVGIPLYVCSTASVPIAAALIAKGISPGAALVFLITGPATNAAGIATLWHIMGARTTTIYLAAIAVTSLGSGWVLDALYSYVRTGGADMALCGWHMPGWVAIASSCIMIAVLGYAIVQPYLHRKKHACCGGH